MSLSGSVEDLPLLEILQVVAFCQKTGFLTVKAPDGDAAVVFRDGRVVSGYIWDVPPLGPEAEALSSEARQEAIRGRITSTLQRLARLREGHFGFNVAQETPSHLGDRDLGPETLEEGINPEGLMLDLARQMDEDRRESSAALEASLSAPLPASDPEPPAEPEPPVPSDAPHEEGSLEELLLEEPVDGPSILLVDDEADVRRFVREQLEETGLGVIEATDARSGRREAARLSQQGVPFILVADLGLPSLSGSNFRGGLEVVDYAASLETRPRILLMAESADERLRNKARRLGVSILVLKPGLSKLDPLQYETDLRAFGRKLAGDLIPRLQRRKRTPTPGEPPEPPPPVSLADEVARETALRSVLDELERHPEPDQVAFLLLRAARAFLPRAILFLVKDDRLRGLAGFGPAASGTSLDVEARELAVSLEEASPFADAVALGRFWSGPPSAAEPIQQLLECIGASGVAAAAVIPVRAQQETIAVLYGDAPGGQPLPPLHPLADFASRAGRVLDEAFLARRGAIAPA